MGKLVERDSGTAVLSLNFPAGEERTLLRWRSAADCNVGEVGRLEVLLLLLLLLLLLVIVVAVVVVVVVVVF